MPHILQRIRSTAPVRICDIGGWTDTWFAGHGKVFNIAVTPLVEVSIVAYPQVEDKRVTLHLENYGESYKLDPDHIVYDRHPLIEATIDSIGIPPGIEVDITVSSQVPAGASVGTSAAVCVALVGALDALTPGRLTPHEIAVSAHRVETEKLSLQSGIQDQLCCAYGGFRLIDMHTYPHATVSSPDVDPLFGLELEARLVLIYIGTPHDSSRVHRMVIDDLGTDARDDPRLEKLRQLAPQASAAVARGDMKKLGLVMNRNTAVQRTLHPGLVCPKFEEAIEIASSFGALGCKVNGAGGDGGSLTILTDGNSGKKKRMLESLAAEGFQSIPIALCHRGIEVERPLPAGPV